MRYLGCLATFKDSERAQGKTIIIGVDVKNIFFYLSILKKVVFFSKKKEKKLQQPQLAHRLPASRGPPPAQPQRPFRAGQDVVRPADLLAC